MNINMHMLDLNRLRPFALAAVLAVACVGSVATSQAIAQMDDFVEGPVVVLNEDVALVEHHVAVHVEVSQEILATERVLRVHAQVDDVQPTPAAGADPEGDDFPAIATLVVDGEEKATANIFNDGLGVDLEVPFLPECTVPCSADLDVIVRFETGTQPSDTLAISWIASAKVLFSASNADTSIDTLTLTLDPEAAE